MPIALSSAKCKGGSRSDGDTRGDCDAKRLDAEMHVWFDGTPACANQIDSVPDLSQRHQEEEEEEEG